MIRFIFRDFRALPWLDFTLRATISGGAACAGSMGAACSPDQ
ncbi:hypothetical protein TVNIR_1762 [Thioalkalivibrio nitratireducens DSM 14787]|uniref:Uncharacterized protein n=1 Tax=Thioalkalivibrio nitratireducens (strain DSM 14787 / UNIQEM 213 / ALEN2) TaxID=1255043 RepID=L0DWU6_THIND|nr:hypothetical protein TVNIR_1762 [Thioalkalivibrio nitratireducens DSM 14787]